MRLFLTLPRPHRSGSLLCGLLLSICAGPGAADTGTPVPALAEFDTRIHALMDKWKLDGAAIAVVRSDKLLFARGYGVADPSTGAPVQPDSLFRLATTSLPAMGATVLKLAGQGLISLDRPVFPLLGLGTPVDARVNKITVRNLLEHASGWDSSTFDPFYDLRKVGNDMGSPMPPDSATLLRWLLRQPLQFEPGTASSIYSLNYVVLGALIAKVTGQHYDDVVRSTLLGAGITRMRPGASLPAGRAAGEVAYRDESGSAPSVFDSVPGQVPFPYGGFALEPFSAYLGWIGSAVDIAALGAALSGQSGRPDLLTPAQLTDMKAKPSFEPYGTVQWRGKGWTVNTSASFVGGSTPGSHARMLSRSDGTTWAVVINTLPVSSGFTFLNEVDVAMQAAVASVSKWPTEDQFPTLLGPATIDGCYGVPSFFAGKLCIPSVSVPNGSTSQRFTAVLDLVDAATYTFRLSSAIPALDASSAEASFDPANGIVTLPRVVLPDADGKPQAYSVQLSVVPGTPVLTLRLSGATLLPS